MGVDIMWCPQVGDKFRFYQLVFAGAFALNTYNSTAGYGYDFVLYCFVLGSLWAHEYIFDSAHTENIMHGCAGLVLSQCIRAQITANAAAASVAITTNMAYLWTFWVLLFLDAMC